MDTVIRTLREWPRMRAVIYYYVATMLLVIAIVSVAVLWTHLSHLNILEGPLVVSLSSTHGVHLFDLAVLGVEFLLVLLLTLTLFAGFTRTR